MDEFFQNFIGAMPPVFWIGWAFLLGSFVGSFLNVVVYRLPRNCLSINNPKRSFCPSCKTQLKLSDNIPIFGWILLRGKCRYCGAKYGARYPAVELLTALLFAGAVWRVVYTGDGSPAQWQSWIVAMHLITMSGVLLPWALIDIDLTYIPDRLTFGPLLWFIPMSAFPHAYQWGLPGEWSSPFMYESLPDWANSMLSALTTGVIAMAFLWLFGKFGNVLFRKQVEKIGGESMGGADIKLMLLLGVMLGWPKLLAGFFLAVASGAIIGMFLRFTKKNLGVPFGPYLALGALIAMYAPDTWVGLIKGYFKILGASL
ncbi:MAG: prepilin peptidase [Planctomycetota bacterium]|jgi:leader peptidase (prepilin peptidase)/N-methyltransferase